MQHQSIKVDLTTNCITIEDKEIRLTPKETELAHVLVKAMPGSARKDEIIIALWGQSECEFPETCMKVHANRLRNKISPFGYAIVFVHGYGGYRMVRAEAVSHAA
jgi:DNA-binding response OmpR family regulator